MAAVCRDDVDRSRSARPEPGLRAAAKNEAFRLKINGLRPAWCVRNRVAGYQSRHSTILPAALRPRQRIPASTNVLHQSASFDDGRRDSLIGFCLIFSLHLHVQDPLTTSL
jgi:hypothetical protein